MKKTILLSLSLMLAATAMGQNMKMRVGQDLNARPKALTTLDPVMA